MTPEEWIDYAFGGLDEAERDRFEREVAADPALTATLDRARRSLDRLLDDGEALEPPPDLARRTLAFVSHQPQRRNILEFVPVSVPFRWADVAVAASIFLAGLMTLLPAVRRNQLQADQTACAFNLGQLGQGLANYVAYHGSYPYPERSCPIPYSGIFKVLLHDSGHLGDPAKLDCPSNGPIRKSPLPDYKALCAMRDRDPQEFRHVMNSDYAYNLGYRRDSGEPGPATARSAGRVPLLSDRPDHDAAGRIFAGNSPNHGGIGQNVLFSDGHVGWYRSRALGALGDTDMFLNQKQRPEPGLTPEDAVLAPGCVPFFHRDER